MRNGTVCFLLFPDGALDEKAGEGAGGFVQAVVSFGTAYDDAAGVKVVVKCLAFAQELGGEQDIVAARLHPDGFRITHRYGALDNDNSSRIVFCRSNSRNAS